MSDRERKPLMRSLGEFVGHIVKGIRTPAEGDRSRTVVRKTTEEARRGDVILRRTTIEEIEMKGGAAPPDADTPETPGA